MSGRASVGWQTALADLALILFMITAAAASRQPADARAHGAGGGSAGAVAAAPSPQAEPLAVYVDAPGAPPLAEWLSQQPRDPRQQVTITARYGTAEGAQERALATASRLARQAGNAGRSARVVVEAGDGPSHVVIAFDSSRVSAQTPSGDRNEQGISSEELARSLLKDSGN